MTFEYWYQNEFKQPYETYDLDIKTICKEAFQAGKKSSQLEPEVSQETCGHNEAYRDAYFFARDILDN